MNLDLAIPMQASDDPKWPMGRFEPRPVIPAMDGRFEPGSIFLYKPSQIYFIIVGYASGGMYEMLSLRPEEFPDRGLLVNTTHEDLKAVGGKWFACNVAIGENSYEMTGLHKLFIDGILAAGGMMTLLSLGIVLKDNDNFVGCVDSYDEEEGMLIVATQKRFGNNECWKRDYEYDLWELFEHNTFYLADMRDPSTETPTWSQSPTSKPSEKTMD